MRGRSEAIESFRFHEKPPPPVTDFSSGCANRLGTIEYARIGRGTEPGAGGEGDVAERGCQKIVQVSFIKGNRRLTLFYDLFQEILLGKGVHQFHGRGGMLRLDYPPDGLRALPGFRRYRVWRPGN
jgi:hypothetical protein